MNLPSSWRWLALATLALCLNGVAVAQNSTPSKDDAPSEAPPAAETDSSDGAVPEAAYQLPDVAPGIAATGQFQRWWWSFEQRTNGGAVELPSSPLVNAIGIMNNAPAVPPSPGVPGSRWLNVGASPWRFGQVGRFIGVQDMSGRVATIAIDPTDQSHWLAGGAQGGVWETTDGGQNWVAKTDNTPSLAMGAIAFAPSNPKTIYAGTGEAAFSGDGYAGRGVLKSTDGGNNWHMLASTTFTNSSFSRIRVHPRNANIAWAAVTSGIAGRARSANPPAPQRGIFKTTNGGNSWELKLPGASASDLALKPGDNSGLNIYGALGFPNTRAENGIYRSSDGGETFTAITGPWSTDPRGVGRIEIAFAPSNPNVMYVSVQDGFDAVPGANDGGMVGLFKTTNAWDANPTFTQISVAATDNGSGNIGYCGWDKAFNSASNQCWYSHVIAVDATDPNILYAGGIPLWRYDGNTNTWTEISKTQDKFIIGPDSDGTQSIHVDQHDLVFAGNRLVVGNDGGVFSTTDRGDHFTNHNTNLSIAQYYEGSIAPGSEVFPGNNFFPAADFGPFTGLMLAGAQDNGTHVFMNAKNWGWGSGGGGDGIDNAISQQNPTTRWAYSSQGLALRRTFNAGSSSSTATAGLPSSRPFVGRFEMCRSNENQVIAASNSNLYRNTGFFNTPFPAFTNNSAPTGVSFTSGIIGLAYAPSDTTCGTYAFSSVSGGMWVTNNSGTTWKNLRSGAAASVLPARTPTDYAFDPNDPNTIYVTFSGFNIITPTTPGQVFKLTNVFTDSVATPYSAANVTPPGFDVPVNTVVVDPLATNVVYVGTDVGVLRSTDGGSSWLQMGPVNAGMPTVAVFEMQINGTKVAAFTHGRGAFVLTTFDLDGDGSFGCSDFDMLKASFNTRIGQPGFNPAADLTNDNQVDVRDLTMMSKQLSLRGLSCH